MHPRRFLREAFKERAMNATAAEDRVFTGMSPPANLESLVEEGPVMCIYAGHEEIKADDYPKSGFDGAVRRTLTMSIEAVAAGVDAEDKADDLAEEIEALFEDWDVPGMPATEIRLMETEINITDGLEVIFGGALLTFEVAYWRSYRADESDDFLADDALIEVVVNDPPPVELPPTTNPQGTLDEVQPEPTTHGIEVLNVRS